MRRFELPHPQFVKFYTNFHEKLAIGPSFLYDISTKWRHRSKEMYWSLAPESFTQSILQLWGILWGANGETGLGMVGFLFFMNWWVNFVKKWNKFLFTGTDE